MKDLTTCNYCNEDFDANACGIVASGESGGVSVQINGIKITRGDEGYMCFCSIDCFSKSIKQFSWFYTDKDVPLKNS